MIGRKMKGNWRLIFSALAVFVVFGLIPAQAFSANMSYGEWELDGFFRNNTGIWTENWEYAPNNDPLATCRNWFRLNLNGKISKSLRLKAEILAVYEPEYSRERGGGIEANEYNYFDFRELRLDWRPRMGHNIRIGRQIVNWGESISARVGDVVNPVDARFDLGFTNLEDTRMPIWMVRGLHQFYNIGTSFDWIFSPYMQADRYRVSRTLAWGPGNITANGTWNGVAEERFTPAPETRIIVHGLGDVTSTLAGVMPVLWAPLNETFYGSGEPADLGYLLGNFDYPDSNLKDARFGFKTSSTIYGVQTGVYFWRGHAFTPPVLYYRGASAAGNALFDTVYERQNTLGFYANKNFEFGVLRMDVAYKPDYDYQTTNVTKHPDMVVGVDTLLTQLGINKDFMIHPLNQNQAFSLTAEYVGEFLVGDADGALVAFPWHIEKLKDSHTFMASIGTNYNFGMYAYNLTVIYNLENNGLIQPSITYNPDWMNRKWSFKLQYANVFAEDTLDIPYGLMSEKDMVILTTQFSFP
jgi:hypothetical protein